MAESIGNLIPTSIPSLTDNADIQAALRLYHYGDGYDYTNSTDTNLKPQSIAKYIDSLTKRITVVEGTGPGSEYTGTMPASPPNGFIWVDSSQSFGGVNGSVAAYQTTAPTSPIVGSLWVDNTTSTLHLKVYDGTTWKVIV